MVGNMWLIPTMAEKPGDARITRYLQKDNRKVKPFLKWAGGKGQLLSEIEKYYPFGDKKIMKYAEPFVGGGAVLFDILSKYDLNKVYISDINAELINTYRMIRDGIGDLVSMLAGMQSEFVPMDTEENLRSVSEKLQKVTIVCGDYRESAAFIDANTFVYFDPPYRPITDTASFTAYTENLFSDEEQVELAKFVDDMHKKGAKVVISNSDPKNSNTEDDFFDNIYSSHRIKRVEATRMINCNSEARGKIKELLISNF